MNYGISSCSFFHRSDESLRGLQNIFIMLSLRVFCQNVHMCAMCVPGVRGDQKVLDSLDCSYRGL